MQDERHHRDDAFHRECEETWKALINPPPPLPMFTVWQAFIGSTVLMVVAFGVFAFLRYKLGP